MPDYTVEALRAPATPPPMPPFDPDILRHPTLSSRIASAILRRPQPFYAVLRLLRPILRLGRTVILFRDDDVREVLSRDADFPVAFDANFQDLDPSGATFLLGMPDSPAYRAIRTETMQVFHLSDIAHIAALARDLAEAIVAEGGGRIDVVQDLIIPVLADITQSYYGVTLPLPDSVQWLMAMSIYDFLPGGGPAVQALAKLGSRHVTPVIEDAMRQPPPDTVVARYKAAQLVKPDVLTDDVIRVTVTGMVAGFVPTCALAYANLLQVMLDRPAMMAAATAAAEAGQDDLLDRCLFEASRWRPINPGPFRHCAAPTTVAAGTRRQTAFKPGDLVLPATGAAMFDPRRVRDPNRFDPNREPGDYLQFGFGQHWCVGFAIARAVMTQMFKPLLAQGNVRRAPGRAGRMAGLGPFPEHMTITYGAAR